MVSNFGSNRPTPPTFIALAFQNELEYRKDNVTNLNGDNSSTSDRSLVSFPPITPEFTSLMCTAGVGQYSGYFFTFARGRHY